MTVKVLPVAGRSLILDLTVPGDPVPLARSRGRQGQRPYVTARCRAEMERIGLLARGRVQSPAEGRVAVELVFFTETLRRKDGDNMQKLVWDALNEVAWWDDDQIVEWHGWKELDRENPRTEIKVWKLIEREVEE